MHVFAWARWLLQVGAPDVCVYIYICIYICIYIYMYVYIYIALNQRTCNNGASATVNVSVCALCKAVQVDRPLASSFFSPLSASAGYC